MILLNPGPVNLTARVRDALLGPDLCHREPEFTALQNEIRSRLLDVYGLSANDFAPVLMTGSGTAAMEAMLSSLVPRGRSVITVENGVYGERLTAIARVYGIPCIPVSHGWGEVIDVSRVRDAISNAVSHVAVVHHETTTGRLNSLEPLAALCAKRGLALLVDAVSSFGAEQLDLQQSAVAGCAATANKCLHGVPGTSFVLARPTAIDAGHARSLYLDLKRYASIQAQGGTPFTQSVQTFYALREALAEFAEQGGWQTRHAHYQALAKTVREGLTELGIKPVLSAEESSVVLASYELPANRTYAELHDGLKQQGFVIYAGQGELAKRIFRISTMGAISEADMQRFLAAFASVVADS